MVAEVRELDEDKLFKIAKLNLKGKTWDWYRWLDPPPNDWRTLHAMLHMKYSVYDEDELRTKMDVVRQELGKKFNCVMIGWSDFLSRAGLWMQKSEDGFRPNCD